jgi:DNA-binding IclR family transcriptional regulator
MRGLHADEQPATESIDGSPGPVSRAVSILKVIAESTDGLTLSQIAQLVGLPRPSTHRQLRVLRDEGMVARDPEARRYRPGSEFYRLAALVVGNHEVVDLAIPFMKRLVEETDESSVLGLYHPEGPHMIYAAQIPSKHALGYRIELNTPSSLAWGATGRAILAALPKGEAEKAINRAKPSPGDGGKVTSTQLRRDLSLIRRRGYASTHGHKIPGAHAIAAPVRASSGRVVGSLSITIPDVRFHASAERRLAERVMLRAAQLSELLGHNGDPGQ